MSTTKVLISGCNGKMGQLVRKPLDANPTSSVDALPAMLEHANYCRIPIVIDDTTGLYLIELASLSIPIDSLHQS